MATMATMGLNLDLDLSLYLTPNLNLRTNRHTHTKAVTHMLFLHNASMENAVHGDYAVRGNQTHRHTDTQADRHKHTSTLAHTHTHWICI